MRNPGPIEHNRDLLADLKHEAAAIARSNAQGTMKSVSQVTSH